MSFLKQGNGVTSHDNKKEKEREREREREANTTSSKPSHSRVILCPLIPFFPLPRLSYVLTFACEVFAAPLPSSSAVLAIPNP